MNKIEDKIKLTIKKFDIICLLQVLFAAGYSIDNIIFRSNDSVCSQSSLIEDIKFYKNPVPWVEIFLNIGLLSAQSPLPSYFRKKVDRELDRPEEFKDFIGYFDHFLIKNYIFNIYPEINSIYYPSWEKTKRRYLHLLDLNACHTLYWLFQNLFPELSIKVKKTQLKHKIATNPVALGKTVLGKDSVIGNETKVPLNARVVILYSDSETTDKGIAWPKEILSRFREIIIPILKPVGVAIELILIIKSQKRWARLNRETYLGYDKIKGGSLEYRRIKIFHGTVSSN